MKTSQRLLVTVTATLILLLAFVPAAFAGKVHFNSIIFNIGSSLDFSTVLLGLVGNETFEINVTATASVTAICEDPGGNQAPGQNPAFVEIGQSVTAMTNFGGRAAVLIEVPDPTSPGNEPSPTPEEAGCPEGYSEVVDIVDGSTNWTAARIVVVDGDGIIQVDRTFACTTFFKDGVTTRVTCKLV